MVNEENIRLIFGLKIKILRQAKGISLSELAEKTDISVSYLNEIEKGKKYPKTDKISVLAKELDTNYDWLVSLKLTKNLAPLATLLRSNLLSDLPLEVFGISPRTLLELISDTPSKLNAFISTIFDLARNHNVTTEDFYFLALRSFQEMQENYFPEIEEKVNEYRRSNLGSHPVTLEKLYADVQKICGCEIDDTSFSKFPELQSFRMVVKVDGKSKKIFLNHLLNDRQKMFILAREIGYQTMAIGSRSYAYPWLTAESFDQLLNNFKATYFAGALIIPEKEFAIDLKQMFAEQIWDNHALGRLMQKYHASPEMLLHRISSLASRHLGIQRLFYMRITHEPGNPKYKLNKEMHLGGLHSPHSTVLLEHYCRRWLGLNIIQELETQMAEGRGDNSVIGAQISDYMDSGNQYLCISVARPLYPTPNITCSITIGFLIDDEFKQKCKFWNSPTIPTKVVNGTCERCSALQCAERVARPLELERKKRFEMINQAFERLGSEG